MVRAGQAWAFVRYASDYVDLEAAARAAGAGLWRRSKPEPPWEFRAKRWAVAAQKAPNGCAIKGNVSRHGDKIFHAPWSPWYSKTSVNEPSGERWFCSEADALKAGWRAPYWY